METKKRKKIRPDDGNIEETIEALKLIAVGLVVLGLLSMIAIPVIKLILR